MDVREIEVLKVLFLAHLYGIEVDPIIIGRLLRTGSEKLKSEHLKEVSHSNSNSAIPLREGPPITVSFGGGSLFLKEFLNGQHSGYATENNNCGMFVSVNGSNRDFAYATRTPIECFDYPAVMTAKIAPQHLLRVNHNGYEAVLTQDKLTHLQDVQIRSFLPNDGVTSTLPRELAISAITQNLPLRLNFDQIDLSQDQKNSVQATYDELVKVARSL